MPVAVRPRLDSVPLVGVRVDHVTMEQTLGLIEGFVRQGEAHHIVTLDASMVVAAQSDADLRAIVCAAELVVPDSAGIRWACRRAGVDLSERVSGVDLMSRLCEKSAASGLRFYFLGARPGVADDAARRLIERYPGCTIVGMQHGYFTESDEPAIVESIRRAHPDVLFVALGIPVQEKWISRYRDTLGVPVLVGVGGSLDVFAGRVKRAPRWMQRFSMEWLFRLFQDPRKLRKVMTLPRFVILVLRHLKRPDPSVL
jgi:N-acetylglucosaminyldiphosphoundecaprenol N-acetyl-beta-D-mannosaminyltransferase